MLTGRKPFVSDQVADLLLMHQSQPAPRMSAVASDAAFSDALETAVARAMAKASADCFASADEMAAALEQIPESTAMRLSAAVHVAAATAPAPGTTAAGDADQTLSDRTLVDASRHRDVEPPPPRPRPARMPVWRRFLRPAQLDRSPRVRVRAAQILANRPARASANDRGR